MSWQTNVVIVRCKYMNKRTREEDADYGRYATVP